jgi:hypothetical protein
VGHVAHCMCLRPRSPRLRLCIFTYDDRAAPPARGLKWKLREQQHILVEVRPRGCAAQQQAHLAVLALRDLASMAARRLRLHFSDPDPTAPRHATVSTHAFTAPRVHGTAATTPPLNVRRLRLDRPFHRHIFSVHGNAFAACVVCPGKVSVALWIQRMCSNAHLHAF